MIICYFAGNTGQHFGVIEGDSVRQVKGSVFGGDPEPDTKMEPLSEIELLAPVHPSKIVCVGRNYLAHAQEHGEDVPVEPLLFFKPPSSVIASGRSIELLPDVGRVDHEAELAVVIKKRGRFIPKKSAPDYILGWTCANDVSARDYQAKDGQWTRAKGFDTFCPLGPWINTDLDAADVALRCRVNGEMRQDARTSEMVFKVPDIIEYISRVMTLEPGDVILTGTPAGVGPLHDGDVVEVEIEGIGTLHNRVTLVSPVR